MRMADSEPSTCFPLQELHGGRLIFPIRPKEFDGTGFSRGRVASRIHPRERSPAQALDELIPRNRRRKLHSLRKDGNLESALGDPSLQ